MSTIQNSFIYTQAIKNQLANIHVEMDIYGFGSPVVGHSYPSGSTLNFTINDSAYEWVAPASGVVGAIYDQFNHNKIDIVKQSDTKASVTIPADSVQYTGLLNLNVHLKPVVTHPPYVFTAADLAMVNNNHATVTMNGNIILPGDKFEFGRVDFTARPGYRFTLGSDGRPNIYFQYNTEKYYASYINNSTSATLLYSTPTTPNVAWQSLHFDVEAIPVVTVPDKNYVVRQVDIDVLTAAHVTATVNGNMLSAGMTIHPGDVIKCKLPVGYYFATNVAYAYPTMSYGILVNNSWVVNASQYIQGTNRSTDGTYAELVFPDISNIPNAKWGWYATQGFINPGSNISGNRNDSTQWISSYGTNTSSLMNIYNVITGVKIPWGSAVPANTAIYFKINDDVFPNTKFDVPYFELPYYTIDGKSHTVQIPVDPADPTRANWTVQRLPKDAEWGRLPAIKYTTMPFKRNTWLNIYEVGETELNDLKFALALASISNQPSGSAKPQIDYSKYVYNLVETPYELPNVPVDKNADIHIWGFSTGVKARMFGDAVVKYDLGTISVPKSVIPTYDFNGSAQLFLPHCDPVDIDLNYVFGYNIRIEYLFNLTSGIVVVNIYCDNPALREGALVSKEVDWGVQIPWDATDWNGITRTELPLEGDNGILTAYIEYKRTKTVPANMFTIPILTNEALPVNQKGYYEVEDLKFITPLNWITSDDRNDFVSAIKNGFIIE